MTRALLRTKSSSPRKRVGNSVKRRSSKALEERSRNRSRDASRCSRGRCAICSRGRRYSSSSNRMEGGALTVMQPRYAKQTNCFLRRRFFAKWEVEGEISVPNGQSHNILIYKELVTSKRGINLDLTDAH